MRVWKWRKIYHRDFSTNENCVFYDAKIKINIFFNHMEISNNDNCKVSNKMIAMTIIIGVTLFPLFADEIVISA